MLLFSKTLNKDINFATFERENDFGKPVKVIFHDSLQDVIHNLTNAKYAFNFVKATPEHTVVVCEMADSTGRRIVEIGESTPATLDTEIAKNYPSLIASQRAFDRAAIRYLDLPGKVFSNMEISIIDEASVEEVISNEAPASKTPVSSGIVSSIVEDDDMLSIDNTDDEVVVTADVAVENEVVVEEDPVGAIDELDVNSVLDDMSSSTSALPFETEEEVEEEDVSGYVVTMNGKYAGKNKTIAEIYATDASWVEWIAANFQPRNAVAERDVAAIKKFVESKKGE